MLVVLVALLCASAAVALPNFNITRCPGNTGPPPDGGWGRLGLNNITGFVLDDGSGPGKQLTKLWACYTADSLYVKYVLQDNNIYNPVRGCNNKLYNADVVEMFIAPGTAVPHTYLELEVSPFSDLFAAKINNPNLTCDGIQDNLIACNATGITWEAQAHHDGFWWAYLAVPWKLIDSMAPEGFQGGAAGSVYRANFFRVDIPKQSDNFEYTCWNPTMSTPPCFHKPAYFGAINLV